MAGEVASTADLLTAAKRALETYYEVRVDDDGALTFRHSEVPCAVQAMQLADGLTVLSLTCVVAWDLPVDGEISRWAAERAGEGMFGTLGVVRTARGMDLTLRYAFPADGLTGTPLTTLLMLIVSTASQLRGELDQEFERGAAEQDRAAGDAAADS
ncbi:MULTISPECIES: hypothetical protein [Actinopolyspora]|uniref:Sensory transduction regulator n=1 Tax=Actinopolyspora saharensis TaxID=995062 RepID=A0A1H1DCR7_9ACTN|nr:MULTISPECIES: hypothetical protein [Actinopolyspora]NHD18523.1 hypothetical protein [Actinopolyspora sp. BKK2]NHE77518.1 hypothetical protein [Actinopolyspora sp. BKK1]SDQ74291.1 hypothetical protein SAMN04489718_2020 [Actinopolyspora saharensis]